MLENTSESGEEYQRGHINRDTVQLQDMTEQIDAAIQVLDLARKRGRRVIDAAFAKEVGNHADQR